VGEGRCDSLCPSDISPKYEKVVNGLYNGFTDISGLCLLFGGTVCPTAMAV